MQQPSQLSLQSFTRAQLAAWLLLCFAMIAVPAVMHAWPAEREPVVSLRVNLNTASREELLSLPSMTYAGARAILQAREKRGPFKSIADLNQIKGLTKSYVERIAELVDVN